MASCIVAAVLRGTAPRFLKDRVIVYDDKHQLVLMHNYTFLTRIKVSTALCYVASLILHGNRNG